MRTKGRGRSTRREFLGRAGGLATVSWLGSALPRAAAQPPATTAAEAFAPLAPDQARRSRAAQVRHAAEVANRQLPVPAHPTNGDEELYSSRIGNYSKGLPHDALGEVDPVAYRSLLDALASGEGDPSAFENVLLGHPGPGGLKLTNPQAGLAFDLQGADSHQLAIPPAPAFASAEQAAEMVELYWMALLRDVDFLDYGGSTLAEAAAAELSSLTDFRGPRSGGRVTASTLFRDDLAGCTVGPYVSQFLWRSAPFGAERVDRRMRTALPGGDQMTAYVEWLAIQNGFPPSGMTAFDPVARYIRSGRDLAQWVHVDVLFQAYFDAMLILLAPPDPSDPFTGGGIGCPFNPTNPYLASQTQIGFGTFGPPHFATLVCEVATRALKAVWYQKWFVHRRLRPEAYGGRVHNHVSGTASYPIHPDVLNSRALDAVHAEHGTYLLPMAFPEGCPSHPSYGAGHATVAGACVTILKALFDEAYEIPDPVVVAADGLALAPYTGPPLTVGGELNKLASNVATGRNIAGLHWRSDGAESLKLGEAVAIGVLRDNRACFNETFAGFTFTRFDGTTVTI
jgi:hypothetical protein